MSFELFAEIKKRCTSLILTSYPTTKMVHVQLPKKTRQTSDGSFSAVSTATIASKDAFFCIFRDLQDLHSFPPLQSQILQIFRDFFRENFRIFSDFCKILLNFCVISAKINKILTQICKISDIRMVQKDANLVDFEKCCKMRLFSLS